MYLFTKSETRNDNVSVTFTGATDNANIIDGDQDTFAETANTAPNLTIDLGERRVIDSLWLQGENLQNYTLKASNNNITFLDIRTGLTTSSGRYSYVKFTNTTAYRYWRLTFSARQNTDPNYRVSEVFLMRRLLDFNTDEKRPFRVLDRIPNDNVVAYRLWNQNLVTYEPDGTVDKAVLTLEWEHIDSEFVDELEALWKGPPHLPEVTVYPRPDSEPDKMYQVKWTSDFQFRNSAIRAHISSDGTETVTQYKRGQIVMEET